MIHVVAILTAAAGKRDLVLAAFKKNIPAVLAEPGCIQYFPVVDLEGAPESLARLGPDAFMVIEQWESPAALQAHGGSPHMAAFGEAVKDLMQSSAVYALSNV
jgi:quinol monooxygenase YgiN